MSFTERKKKLLKHLCGSPSWKTHDFFFFKCGTHEQSSGTITAPAVSLSSPNKHAHTPAHTHSIPMRALPQNTRSAEVSHLRAGVERPASCVKFQASVSQISQWAAPRLNIQQRTCEKCWHRDVEHRQQQQQRTTLMKHCSGLFSTFLFFLSLFFLFSSMLCCETQGFVVQEATHTVWCASNESRASFISLDTGVWL